MNPFNKPLDELEQDFAPPSSHRKSQCSDEENHEEHCRDPNRMKPAEIQANLNMFMADQKAEMNANKILFLSPEEREKMEKAKLKVKRHFQNFFRRHMIKNSKLFFNKWISYVEFVKGREQEFNNAKKMVLAKKKFRKKLMNEFDKQQSKRLLNGIKALNQNNLKNEDEVGDEHDQTQSNASIVGKDETKEAF